MRRFSFLLGALLIVSMVLAACGGEQTSTSVPSTNVPPVTAEATMTEPGTDMTATPEGTAEATTPGVPVTGEESTSRVTNLLDYDVWNQDGEQIGEVEDMVLDLDNSKVSYVVIETGGFLDIGDKTVLVPWNMLELQTPVSGGNENAYVIAADPQMLDNAPDTDLQSVLPEMGQPATDWDTDIRNFWEGGVMPEATASSAEATSPAMTGEATIVPEMSATATTGTGMNELQGVMLATDVLGSTIMVGQGTAMGTGTGAMTAEATSETTPTVDMTASPVATSSTGTGTGTALQGGTEATVEDIIVDPNAGDIQFLVLSTTFEDGDRWIPVPLSAFGWDSTNQSLSFTGDSSMLQNAPFFAPDAFPDTSMDGWDSDYNDFWQNN